MALPALARLSQAGYDLRLVGKRWAGALLAGQFEPPAVLPSGTAARIRRLRALRDAPPPLSARGGQVDTLLLTNSFSSALESRLAGLHPLGYRQDGRSWLLSRGVRPPATAVHESARFDTLARALIEHNARIGLAPDQRSGEASPWPQLLLSTQAEASAESLLASRLANHQDGQPAFACLVPFATGTLKGAAKAWPQFPAFAAELATRLPVVVVPGPAEVEQTRRDFPGCISLENVDLGVYGAILARASVVVANDTGPAHLAAAVGAPLVSVLGPTDAGRYRPLGPRTSIVQASPWPTVSEVRSAVDRVLAVGGQAGQQDQAG